MIALEASMTARMPEPQTLWRVMHGTDSGIPAPSEACRAGAWPMPAWSTFPMITCSTSAGATPAFSSAPRMAADPSAGAESDDSCPRNVPTGVRAAERMTMFFILFDSNADRLHAIPRQGVTGGLGDWETGGSGRRRDR